MNTNNRPLILVSNDDGYFAPGLKYLIEAVKPYGEVIAVAPEEGVSGMSHAITIKHPLRLTHLSTEENVSIYKVNGTPADCIKLALNQLCNRKPTLVVAGINHGSNSSISVIYSGTLGAAMEGAMNGIPSVGFSLTSHSMNADFTVAKKYAQRIVEHLLNEPMEDYSCLNVNFPVCTEEEFQGMAVCRQAKGVWKEEYDKRTDPHGKEYFWLTGRFNNFEPDADDTDEWRLARNYGTIVPVRIDFTQHKQLEGLSRLNDVVNCVNVN